MTEDIKDGIILGISISLGFTLGLAVIWSVISILFVIKNGFGF